MTPRNTSTPFARLLFELSRCSGAELERALADSAHIFARLGPAAEPRCSSATGAPPAICSLERAELELAGLIARAVAVLFDQAADALERGEDLPAGRREMGALLREELQCAASTHLFPSSLLAHGRKLAGRLPRAACGLATLRDAAQQFRALPLSGNLC